VWCEISSANILPNLSISLPSRMNFLTTFRYFPISYAKGRRLRGQFGYGFSRSEWHKNLIRLLVIIVFVILRSLNVVSRVKFKCLLCSSCPIEDSLEESAFLEIDLDNSANVNHHVVDECAWSDESDLTELSQPVSKLIRLPASTARQLTLRDCFASIEPKMNVKSGLASWKTASWNY